MDETKEYIRIRIDDAENLVHTVERLIEIGDLRSAANRIYYIFFYLMSAFIASKELSVKSHSGLISTFTSEYISTGIIDKDVGKTIRNAFDNRSKADYALKPSISEKDIKVSLKKAKEFIIFSKNYFKIEQG